MTDDDLKKEELAELVKNLPLKLRVGVQASALQVAIQEKVIAVRDDGKLEWLLESKTLLAYFGGRMWCGDELTYNKRRRTYAWKLGRKDFPAQDLEALFCVTGLKNLRQQRNFRTPPRGFELIDNLFDMASMTI